MTLIYTGIALFFMALFGLKGYLGWLDVQIDRLAEWTLSKFSS